jgi:hypothetical protein
MRDLAVLFVHLIATVARLLGRGGARSVVAESLLLKHQLLILNRSRTRAPNLRPIDRVIAGLCTGLMRPSRLLRSAIVLKPATIMAFHRALVKRKYHLLFTPRQHRRPGPKGPARELITAIAEMKHRNPRFGCRRIAQQLAFMFGVEIDKDVNTARASGSIPFLERPRSRTEAAALHGLLQPRSRSCVVGLDARSAGYQHRTQSTRPPQLPVGMLLQRSVSAPGSCLTIIRHRHLDALAQAIANPAEAALPARSVHGSSIIGSACMDLRQFKPTSTDVPFSLICSSISVTGLSRLLVLEVPSSRTQLGAQRLPANGSTLL